MSKNYYKTSEGLIFSLYNTREENTLIEELKNVDLEELNRASSNGKFIGIVAVEMHKNKVFQYLVEKGIDLTIKNGSGFDLLFKCVMAGNFDCAKILLDKHGFQDSISKTLDYAISPSCCAKNMNIIINIIKLLIQNGARLSEYYYNSLFDTEKDCDFNYDREDLRSFYKNYLLSASAQQKQEQSIAIDQVKEEQKTKLILPNQEVSVPILDNFVNVVCTYVSDTTLCNGLVDGCVNRLNSNEIVMNSNTAQYEYPVIMAGRSGEASENGVINAVGQEVTTYITGDTNNEIL